MTIYQVAGQKSVLAFGLMGKDKVPVVAMLGRVSEV
jgi:purine-nucleoside phosphorylase